MAQDEANNLRRRAAEHFMVRYRARTLGTSAMPPIARLVPLAPQPGAPAMAPPVAICAELAQMGGLLRRSSLGGLRFLDQAAALARIRAALDALPRSADLRAGSPLQVALQLLQRDLQKVVRRVQADGRLAQGAQALGNAVQVLLRASAVDVDTYGAGAVGRQALAQAPNLAEMARPSAPQRPRPAAAPMADHVAFDQMRMRAALRAYIQKRQGSPDLAGGYCDALTAMWLHEQAHGRGPRLLQGFTTLLQADNIPLGDPREVEVDKLCNALQLVQNRPLDAQGHALTSLDDVVGVRRNQTVVALGTLEATARCVWRACSHGDMVHILSYPGGHGAPGHVTGAIQRAGQVYFFEPNGGQFHCASPAALQAHLEGVVGADSGAILGMYRLDADLAAAGELAHRPYDRGSVQLLPRGGPPVVGSRATFCSLALLLLAHAGCTPEVLNLLLDRGASVHQRTQAGMGLLPATLIGSFKAGQEPAPALRQLLARGADYDARLVREPGSGGAPCLGCSLGLRLLPGRRLLWWAVEAAAVHGMDPSRSLQALIDAGASRYALLPGYRRILGLRPPGRGRI